MPLAVLLSLTMQVGLEPQHTGTTAEFRGLHAASSRIVWASGRGGVVAKTADGGTTWHVMTIPGADSLFLVDVHAFGADRACVLGTSFSGGLARIYRTGDGGAHWAVAYEDRAPGVFLDGLAFWDDRRGVAFGDPVNGTFDILVSGDGCRSWSRVPGDALPPPLDGEAGFAASGTAIAVAGAAHGWIGTGGGTVARVLRTTDAGHTWTAHETPLPGGATAGIFGVAFRDVQHGLAVGGDYRQRTASSDNVLRTSDGGVTWEIAGTAQPLGIRYGVDHDPNGPVIVAVGPSGLGYSTDGGATWAAVDTISVNTVSLGRHGFGWVAGVEGRVWRLTLLRR